MMAPPFKTLRPDQLNEVETLAAVLNVDQIADYFSMGRRTFYDLMARNEEIAASYKRGKARAVGSIAQNLIAKARSGHVTAMIFYLKTQGGWRETMEIESRTEVVGSAQDDSAFIVLADYLDTISARMAAAGVGPPEDLTVEATPIKDEGE